MHAVPRLSQSDILAASSSVRSDINSRLTAQIVSSTDHPFLCAVLRRLTMLLMLVVVRSSLW